MIGKKQAYSSECVEEVSLLKNPFMSFSLTPGRRLRAPLLGVLSPVRGR